MKINHLYKKLPKLPYNIYKENEFFKNMYYNRSICFLKISL
nr:MAG TPA: hypothetical protein [Caudoviricetes sp.]